MTGPIQIGRYFNQALASEIDADYVRITRERIKKFSDGELLLRPMGNPYINLQEMSRQLNFL